MSSRDFMMADDEEATDRYQVLLELSSAQLVAVDALEAGMTHQEAADLAGVHRVTVSRWVQHHPGFRAETARRRAERADRVAALADAATAAAINAVVAAIEAGDVSAAIAWLRVARVHVPIEESRKKAAACPDSAAEVLDDEAYRRSNVFLYRPIGATDRDRAAVGTLRALTAPMAGD